MPEYVKFCRGVHGNGIPRGIGDEKHISIRMISVGVGMSKICGSKIPNFPFAIRIIILFVYLNF